MQKKYKFINSDIFCDEKEIEINKIEKVSKNINELNKNINEINVELSNEKNVKFLEKEVKNFIIKNLMNIENKLNSMKKELEELKIELYQDSLIKDIFNRKKFEEDINKLIEDFQKNNIKSLYIVVMDIDNFKEINDNYGHLIGDKTLMKFGRKIVENFGDITKNIYRYGGDEFILLIYNINEKILEGKIKNFINKLNKIKIKYLDKTFKITVSVGCAKYKRNLTKEEFIEIADKNLYKVKKEKKNSFLCGF